MINRIEGWENIPTGSIEKIPVGGYVCKILKAEVANVGQNDALVILFDVIEGQYKGYYGEEYKANSFENKKWKGKMNYFLPNGGDKDKSAKVRLRGFITSVEESNPGYVWNWDEKSLVGKTVGIILRAEEWAYNGNHGWTNRPFRACSAEKIRNGEFKIPDDKPLQNAVVNAFTNLEPFNEDELPY